MNPIVEAVAFLLGFLAWIMVGVALPNRYWRVSTVDGNVITTSTIYENLWMSCATDSTGVHNCRDFPSLLALSGKNIDLTDINCAHKNDTITLSVLEWTRMVHENITNDTVSLFHPQTCNCFSRCLFKVELSKTTVLGSC